MVTPARPVVGPGEPVELEVTTRDQLGRPVAAELSLAMVDRALLARFGDRLPPIRPTFNNMVRSGAFATRATNTFRYAPRAASTRVNGTGGSRRPRSIDAPPRSTAAASCSAAASVDPRDRPQASGEHDPSAASKEARNRAALAILDEPIRMPFAAETSLDDVLKYIKQATATDKHPALPIYVDPIGLQEAESAA